MTPPVTNAMWSKNTLECEKEIFFSRQEFHGYNRRPDPAGVEMGNEGWWWANETPQLVFDRGRGGGGWFCDEGGWWAKETSLAFERAREEVDDERWVAVGYEGW